MKRFIPLVVLAFITAPAFASGGKEFVRELNEDGVSRIEHQLALVLRSESPYLVVDAGEIARTLKEIRPEQSFSELVIPLMAIIKDDGRTAGERVVAARALHELRNPRGDFAIRRAAIMDESELLRTVSLYLAYERLQKR